VAPVKKALFGLLGNDLLGQYTMAVDYRQLRVNFWKP